MFMFNEHLYSIRLVFLAFHDHFTTRFDNRTSSALTVSRHVVKVSLYMYRFCAAKVH